MAEGCRCSGRRQAFRVSADLLAADLVEGLRGQGGLPRLGRRRGAKRERCEQALGLIGVLWFRVWPSAARLLGSVVLSARVYPGLAVQLAWHWGRVFP